MESPTLTIRAGHRRLLETFRDFARELDGDTDDAPKAETLRAAVAFLRQGLLPFTRWEEQALPEGHEIREETAFEHAFLNAEIDALAEAAESLAHHGSGAGPDVIRRIRRGIHRVEAVLELHVEKAEDRCGASSSDGSAGEGDPAPATGFVREMSPAEVRDFLRGQGWGTLCTVGEGVPYAVPVSFGYDGRDLYVATGRGRKRSNLERCPAVCFTVAEVTDARRWRSVVVVGEAHPVTDLGGRLRGLDLLRRQRQSGPVSAADLARLARAAVFRITPGEVTGRACSGP